jgi:LPS O-antigen subunit length determinant protein (WzzB/FepE family)
LLGHDPTNAERRRRGQSRGGRSKPGREVVAIRARLSDLADDVLAGRVDRADAAVAGQLLGTVIRAIGTEMKVRETEELARELQEVREILENRKDSRRRWG